MKLRFVGVLLALIAAPLSHAAFVTIDEAGMDAVYSQASFGNTPVDIRIGPQTELVRPDLLNIQTDAQIFDLFGQHVGPQNVVNFYFVDIIDSCGGYNVLIVGCGETPGQDFAVESNFAAGAFGTEILAHELGHNLGLPHRAGGLMNPFLNGQTDLNAAEVATILASPLVQIDAEGQRFIQINPVLVVAEAAQVSEPQTLLLLLLGLGLIAGGLRSRGAQAA